MDTVALGSCMGKSLDAAQFDNKHLFLQTYVQVIGHCAFTAVSISISKTLVEALGSGTMFAVAGYMQHMHVIPIYISG